MLISEREAAWYLAVEAGLSRAPARALLQTGTAGTPRRGPRRSLLYDSEAVAALARRPIVDLDRLAEQWPTGLVVARIARDTPWRTDDPEHLRLERLAGPWQTAFMLRVAVSAWVRSDGYFPLLATVSGYVVDGADIITEPYDHPDGGFRLDLRPASDWFEALKDRRWPEGRGGLPLHWWRPMPTAARSRRRAS